MSIVSFQVLSRDLARALRRKRPELDLDSVILHQDNAPPHRAQTTILNISLLGFEILTHSPYSPDLAPMDFHVFPQVKKELRGFRHTDREELNSHVQQVVRRFDEDWYKSAFDNWTKRHQNVLLSRDPMWKNIEASDLLVTGETRRRRKTSCNVTVTSTLAPRRVGYVHGKVCITRIHVLIVIKLHIFAH